MAKRLTLNTQLNISFLLALFIPIAIASYFSINYFSHKIKEEAVKTIRADAKIAEIKLDNYLGEVAYLAQICAREGILKLLFGERWSAKISEALRKIAVPYDLMNIIVTDEFQTIIANTANSGMNGEKLPHCSFIDRALNGETLTLYESLDNSVVLCAATPFSDRSEPHEPVGAVLVRKKIDENMMSTISQAINAKTAVFTRNEVIQGDRSLFNPAVFERFDRQGTLAEQIDISPSGFLSVFIPLRNDTGNTVAVLAISRSAEEYAVMRRNATLTLIGITLAGLLLAYIAKATIQKRIVDRIMSVITGTRQIAAGDLDYRIAADADDEIAQLAKSFNHMTAQLQVYRDNLEGKVLERTRELKKLQNELIQHAHNQGQAQMAIGYLHNLGNAVTPVKAYNTMAIRRLRENVITQKLPEIFGGLPDLILKSRHPDKRRLSEIIKLLPGVLKNEKDVVIKDFERMMEVVTRIEDIIRLQMSYAADSLGPNDTVSINHLIEDAIRIIDSSLSKRDILLTKKFANLPLVDSIDRVKLLLIVENLLKNAYEAIDMANEQGFSDGRRITVSTSALPSCIKVSIKDTGIGFSPQEKDRLFTFGFTTKKSPSTHHTGSGFGLYSAERYLSASGGTIAARSDGIGTGSEFIITIPLTKTKEND